MAVLVGVAAALAVAVPQEGGNQRERMDYKRIIRHLVTGQSIVNRAFPPATLTAIEQAIARSETVHDGEIVLAVEASLDLPLLLENQSVRERAIDVFSMLRVWDTEHNNGVLIYLLMADHDIEIVADRGIHVRVEQTIWETACDTMKAAFRHGRFEAGIITGIDTITPVLQRFFPAGSDKKKEGLSDRPVVL